MRKPSSRMYDIKCSKDLPVKAPMRIIGFLLIGIIIAVILSPLAAVIVLSIKNPEITLFVIPPTIAYYLFFIILNNRSNKRIISRLKEMAGERQGLSICQFARSFDCRKVDTWIIRAVYDSIQDQLSWTGIENFPVKADDNIFDSLKIDPEDFEYDIEDLAELIGRTSDNIENNPYCGKVLTVKDLVYFFNNQPLIAPH